MADYLPRQKFPPWLPDLTDQLPGVSVDVQNVIPTNSGWGPFPSFVPFSGTLPAPARGHVYARNADGSVTIFAGTAASKLYKLDNTTFNWVDVSQGAGTYTALAANRQWDFAQFNNQLIACQGLANPQVFTLGVSTAFADLGGSPPQADFVSVVNRFLMLSGIPAQPYRVQWSDLDNITQWTAGVGQADFQDLPDGGRTLGIAGFDLYAVIFQDQMARLMTYAPGSPVIFTISKITGGDGNGLFAPYGWIIDQDNVFWISQEGFKVLSPGGAPQPIGKEMVDRYFFGNVDTGNLQLVLAETDPAASRLYIGFKSTSGQAGLFDIILIYDWRLTRWSRVFQSGQFLATMSRPGSTLEGMDLPTPGAVSITGAAAGAANVAPTATLRTNSIGTLFNSGSATPAVLATAAVGSGVVVAVAAANANATINALTDSAGNTYTKVIAKNGTPNAEIWYNGSIANQITSGTHTFTATTSSGQYQIPAIQSVAAGLLTDQTVSASGTAVAPSLATTTLAQAVEFVFGFASTTGATGYVESTGFNNVVPLTVSGLSSVAETGTFSTAAVTWNPSFVASETFSAVLATFKATSNANAIRLAVTSTSGMATAQQQTVFGKWNVTQIVGTAPFLAAICNVQNTATNSWGSWAISIFDGTHVDLVGSTFAGAYTSGGILGANIELIPFSFDTVSSSSLPSLTMFNSGNMMGFFNGPNLQAIIETNEAGTPEKRMWVEGFRVISDAPTVFGSVSFRDNPSAGYNYTTEVGLDGFTGTILVSGGGIDTRYSRIKIRIPAGQAWTYALGVEPIGEVTGRY